MRELRTGELKTTEGETRAADGANVPPAEPAGSRPGGQLPVRVAVAVACGLLGFFLIAQVRATETFPDRLEVEREEDLAQILSELSTQSESLQAEITDLRLTLFEFETSAEREELALRSLEQRFDDLRILTGVVPARGPGITFTIADPDLTVTQDLLVDAVQELRDAGAEALAVNGVRLVASSSFSTRNGRIVVDRQPVDPPFVLDAIGPSETLAGGLAIRGGSIDSLQLLPGVTATTEPRADIIVPAVAEPPVFVFGDPVPPEASE